jgi:hypothetical protein
MQLNKHFDSEFTKLLEKYNGFFAFSTKQFDEAKKEGHKYISLDGGLLLGRPIDSELTGQQWADKFFEELEVINKESARLDIEEYGLQRVIQYELDNHETSYTGDITRAFEALEKYGVTIDQVRDVFRGKTL